MWSSICDLFTFILSLITSTITHSLTHLDRWELRYLRCMKIIRDLSGPKCIWVCDLSASDICLSFCVYLGYYLWRNLCFLIWHHDIALNNIDQICNSSILCEARCCECFLSRYLKKVITPSFAYHNVVTKTCITVFLLWSTEEYDKKCLDTFYL